MKPTFMCHSRYSDSQRVGGRDFLPPFIPTCDAPTLLYNWYLFSFPGVKRPGRGVDYPSHLVMRLKKEQSYTSSRPHLDLHGLYDRFPNISNPGYVFIIDIIIIITVIILGAGMAQSV